MTGRVLILGLTLAAGSTLHPLGQQRFRSGTDAVRVDVLVTDGNRPVVGLRAEDFVLLDQGLRQEIDAVTIEDIPVSMMLALDVSESVEGRPLRGLIDATGAATASLGDADRVALVTFSEAVELRSEWSSGGSQIGKILPALSAGGATSLVDASFAALTLRDLVPDRRHLLLLFTDGDDTSSWLSWRAVLDRAGHSDIVVYGVTLGSGAAPRSMPFTAFVQHDGEPPPDMLERLTEMTGGRVLGARNPEDLRQAFVRIVREFRSRYLLTYSPRGVEGSGWHKLDVTLKGRKGKVTARRGYLR